MTPVEQTATSTDGDETAATTTDGDETTTQIQSTDLSTITENNSEVSDPPDTNDDVSDGDGNGGSGGSETPVGAIVGGTIGGVALIALVGLALWFLRIYKRKQEVNEEKVEPYGGGSQSDAVSHPGPFHPTLRDGSTLGKTPEPDSEYHSGSGGDGGLAVSEMDSFRQTNGPAELDAFETIELQGDFARSR